MKKIIWLLSFLLLISFLWLPVYADTGPKPYVLIHLKGIEMEEVYGTLLSCIESTGPATVYNPEYPYFSEEEEDYEIYKAFLDFKDEDGFYFLQWFWKVDDYQFKWGYYPPNTFKVCLYFPKWNSFVVSEIEERYAFDSIYYLDLNDIDLNQKVSYVNIHRESGTQIKKGLIQFAQDLVVTLFLEIGIAFFFGLIKKRQIVVLILTNLVTQFLLHLILTVSSPLMVGYLFMEVLILGVEYFIYRKHLCTSDCYLSNKKIFMYTLVANLVSFLFGII